LLAIKEFFSGSGYLYPKLEDYTNCEMVQAVRHGSVEYFNSKPAFFIPFFDKFPLFTRKYLDYLDFKKFLALKEAKAYRTEEGLKDMEKLVQGMNTGRDGDSKRKAV